MRADILEIYEASIRARQKFDADQKRFGPELQPQRSREPRQTEPLSELAKLLAFLRTYRTDDPPAGPVTILYKDGKPYEMTEAEKARAAEEARSQRELEEFWSTPEKRRLRAEIEYATAKRKNWAEDRLRRYGVLVNGEIDWSTYVHALRKVGKPLKDFLKPIFDLEAENNSQPGKQPIAYIADLAEMIDLVESKTKKRLGYWRRARSLDLRADMLHCTPEWRRRLRQRDLELCDRIDSTTCISLWAPDVTVKAGACFFMWHGIPIPYYPELRDFYHQSCRPRRYCALSRRPLLAPWLREKRDLELAAAKRNREMVQRNERASYFLGDEPLPKRKPHGVQHRGTLGNEKGDSAELDEILRIAKSEAKRAVRILSASDPSSRTDVSERFFDDLNQVAVIVALIETQTDKCLPLDGAPLRRKIRSRLKREIGRLRMRDYHHGEGLPDTDGMNAEEEAVEMLGPTALSRFDIAPHEANVAYGADAEEPAGDASAFQPTEVARMNESVDDEPLRERLVMMALSEGPVTEGVGGWEKLANLTLNERETAIVAETYEGWTAAEVGKRLGCHQTTVQRALKKIAERANLPEPV